MDNFLKDLTPVQRKLNSKIFNLVVGRVFKTVYLNFDEKGRKYMEGIFLFGGDEEKEKFVKAYIPNFEKLFEVEAIKIEEELKTEIEKVTGEKK